MKRLIFAGTPAFAAVALERLLAAGFEVPLVLTQPDRPAGRGMKVQASAVKQLALDRGLPLAQPRSLRLDGAFATEADQARTSIEQARADAMIVAAYGLILPGWVLALPPLGCLNIHASLLPRWRGAAPIQRAIEAGDTHTGITIMQMDAGLDTGDMLLAERLPIAPDDTTASLHDRLAALGGRLVVEALELAACGGLRPTLQPAAGVTYAHKIGKAEAQIDWRQPASTIERRVRAFNPAPGASTTWNGENIKVWASRLGTSATQTAAARPVGAGGGADGMAASFAAKPGQILSASASGIDVQTGDGVLSLSELQRAGGKRLPAGDFLRGFPLAAGQCFDGAPEVA